MVSYIRSTYTPYSVSSTTCTEYICTYIPTEYSVHLHVPTCFVQKHPWSFVKWASLPCQSYGVCTNSGVYVMYIHTHVGTYVHHHRVNLACMTRDLHSHAFADPFWSASGRSPASRVHALSAVSSLVLKTGCRNLGQARGFWAGMLALETAPARSVRAGTVNRQQSAAG